MLNLLSTVSSTEVRSLNGAENNYVVSSAYVIVLCEDKEEIRVYPYSNIDSFLRGVSRAIAFSDCSQEEIVKIMYEGEELVYLGWQPDMRYEYAIKNTGEVVFDNYFPQWNH